MTKMVKPPVLLSRMLTFTLSASIVVLAVLILTLLKMIPLERPEVFFLVTPPASTNVVITPLEPDAKNKQAIALYEEGFIRSYILARNTINSDASLTRNNWAKIVRPWSSAKVDSAFVNTKLYQEYNFNTSGERAPFVSCSVEFPDSRREMAIIRTKTGSINNNEYTVNFMWICENIGGQTTRESYKIRIKIQTDLKKGVSGVVENIGVLSANPLGIQITEYTVLNGKEDPLNFKQGVLAKGL